MATTSASFTRPKTAREEAAALERSKREAEMAEMRRLRQAMNEKEEEEEDLTPAEAARKKREEEMAELRRLKADSNNEMRKKLQEKGGSLITDMDAWRAEQLGAKDKDRKNKLDAQSGLHTYQGSYTRNKTNAELGALEDRKNKAEAESNLHGHKGIVDRAKTNAELDKAALTQAQKEQMARMGQLSLGGKDQGVNGVPSNETSAVEGDDNAPKESVKQAAEKLAKMEKEQAENRRLSSSGTTTKKVVETSKNPPPEAAPQPPKQTPKVQYDISDTNAPAEEAPRITLKPPTYSRVDIKFSFGLIVRSSAADGFNGENLRDNETLKKCMEGTSKILKEQMPSPPDVAKLMEKNTTETSLKVKFPQSYYEPTFEPTVISIEEDKKNEDSSKVTARGNKRTLVKASFPVFMRDEDGVSEEDKKRSARMLKETKTTVFKALRSAVSGGSFLR